MFSLNFLSSQSKQEDFIYGFGKYSMEMNTAKKEWKLEGNQLRYVTFYLMNGENEVYLGKVQFVEVRQSSKSKVGDSQCVIGALTPVNLSQRQFSFSIERIYSEGAFTFNNKTIHKVRVYEVSEKEPWSRVSWRRIYKNQDRYEDCGMRLKERSQTIMEEA